MISNTPRNGDPPYFQWLMEKVSANNYLLLCRSLYRQQYKWIIPRDENRANDGVYLRQVYMDETAQDISDHFHEPCSMLEMLVALVLRMEREVIDIPAAILFGKIIENLYLAEYDDEHFNEGNVYYRVDKFLKREYDTSGEGGPFPLYNPSENQRKVELWEQMQQWVAENYSLV